MIRNKLEKIELIPNRSYRIMRQNPSEIEEKLEKNLITIFSEYFLDRKIDNVKIVEDFDIFSENNMDSSILKSKVLTKVAEIPFGEIRSYKDIANSVGTRAYRAVGTILAKNQFPILIPCHRVVPDKYKQSLKKEIHEVKVGGFMGSIDRSATPIKFKFQLLKHEYLRKLLRFDFPKY